MSGLVRFCSVTWWQDGSSLFIHVSGHRTDQPNFKVVSQILEMEPDLIFVRDSRGNSPLSYIPRQNWGEWNRYLDENRNLLLPKSDDVRTVG